jgi:pyruvate formate lyase activating enzyme
MNNIKGFLETSFIDWPGRSCAVLFLGGCNFRCPFCHNHQLVLQPGELVSHDLEEILVRLRPLRNWLGGICISGGEPTLSPELPELVARLRAEGFAVKLDSNGSHPEVLAALLAAGLLEMVAMDIKAPLEQELYDRCCGVRVDLARIGASIELLRASGIAHQFRMTVVPGLHGVAEVERWVAGQDGRSALKLQNYNPRSALAPALAGARGFTEEEFSELLNLLGEADGARGMGRS